MAKSETFIRNLRWKTFHFKGERPKEFEEKFGFNLKGYGNIRIYGFLTERFFQAFRILNM